MIKFVVFVVYFLLIVVFIETLGKIPIWLSILLMFNAVSFVVLSLMDLANEAADFFGRPFDGDSRPVRRNRRRAQ